LSKLILPSAFSRDVASYVSTAVRASVTASLLLN
jgi:hypothetical protein